MATITFTIKDEDLADYIKAFSTDYESEINGSPNPVTRAQFAKRVVADILSREIMKYRRREQLESLAPIVAPIIN